MCLVEDNCGNVLNASIEEPRGHEASGMETNDRLSELPNELILLVLSFLTTKEVRRTSVISKKWRRWLLGYYPKLNFQGSREIERIWFDIRDNDVELAKERSSFVKEVDRVMKEHLDSSIDEFRVVFDLDTSWQSCINHWVAFALTKQVKTLELDFQPVYDRLDSDLTRCGLFIDKSIIPSLASLSLNFVNITSQVVDNILLSCPLLENLHIRKSKFLTSIKSESSSLKQLDVSDCYKLETIDISAPKMVFFRYIGQPIELNIRNAVSLSSLFIGGGPGEDITYALDAMSKYLSQLEVLRLQLSLGFFLSRTNVGVEHLQLPHLTTLKMLELYIGGCTSSSLLGWAPLIEACPVLEKLTVTFQGYDSRLNWSIITKRSGSPLKSLKTLKIFGYCGRRGDIEFATYVVENAINLEQVFVEVRAARRPKVSEYNDPIRINELKEIIPEGVGLILTESNKY